MAEDFIKEVLEDPSNTKPPLLIDLDLLVVKLLSYR